MCRMGTVAWHWSQLSNDAISDFRAGTAMGLKMWGWLGLVVMAAAAAPQCPEPCCRNKEYRESVLDEPVVSGGRLSVANQIIYRVGIQTREIPDDIRPHVIGAVRSAVTDWNSHRDLSNLVLELDLTTENPGTGVDLWVAGLRNSAFTGKCAEFRPQLKDHPEGAVVYNVAEFESWVPADPEAAARVISHEIGHFFGLADFLPRIDNFLPETNSVMSQGRGDVPNPCRTYGETAIARRPTKGDARAAGRCLWTHHKKFGPNLPAINTIGMGAAAGLVFGLLSVMPAAAQHAVGHAAVPATVDVPRRQGGIGPEPIPDAALRVTGDYLRELAPAEEFIASLQTLAKYSDLIVVAKVQAATSYLSKDHLSIATIYQAGIRDYLKQPSSTSSAPLAIDVVLPGGKVILPSGRSAEFRIKDRQPLISGAEYLFFLQRADEADHALPAHSSAAVRYVPRLGVQGIFQITDAGFVKPGGEDINPELRQYDQTPRIEFVKKIQEIVREQLQARR